MILSAEKRKKISEYFEDKPVGLEYVQMKIDIEKILNKSVDLVTDKSLSKYIKPVVNKEKVLIYEKSKQR